MSSVEFSRVYADTMTVEAMWTELEETEEGLHDLLCQYINSPVSQAERIADVYELRMKIRRLRRAIRLAKDGVR